MRHIYVGVLHCLLQVSRVLFLCVAALEKKHSLTMPIELGEMIPGSEGVLESIFTETCDNYEPFHKRNITTGG